MATRLEDAVISVRIETGRARSQLHSLKSDIGDLGEEQRMIRQRALEAWGAYMPGVPPGERRPPPGAKRPGVSSRSDSDTGPREASPGELKNPLRYLQNVRTLQEIAQGRTPGEIMAKTGGIMAEVGGETPFGKIGKAIMLFGKAKRWIAWEQELEQSVAMGARLIGTSLERDREKGQREWFGGSRSEILDSAEWEAERKKEDQNISRIISMEESFNETRSMMGAAALAGGKAFSADEFLKHFDRFADYHEFMYQFNRRNRRMMQMEAGMSIMEDTMGSIGSLGGAAKFFDKVTLGRF